MKKTTLTENVIEDRRMLLRSIPAAAIAGLAIADLLPSLASGQAAPANAAAPAYTKENFMKIGTADLLAEGKALNATPGKEGATKVLYLDKNFKINVWNEKATSAEEFEWHEGTDHIVTVIEGSTSYEVGGTPQGGHNLSPGQWKAPASPGATPVTLNKGDIFVVRRGTPHKRTTKDSVIFTLSSPTTA